MKVVETWDINVQNTNTLFKNFDLSKVKYGNIKNAKVVDLQTNKNLSQIDVEMYHVPKDSYYALELNSHKFEIAWGVGLDNKIGHRKYQISYTVEDVVTQYQDCQEIYWQFLAKNQNDIPAKKVTGKLILPEDVSKEDNLKVWGHGQLNGKIEKNNNHEVVFEINNLNAGSMLEIRVITQDKMFNVSENKDRKYNYLQTALKEENKWADEANQQSKNAKVWFAVMICIYLIICIIIVIKIRKIYKINQKENDGIQQLDLEYFREIPRKDATPAEAIYLYNFSKTRLNAEAVQQSAVSASILNLCLKKKISLRIDEEKKVYVTVLENEEALKDDENQIYKMLKDVSKNDSEFEIGELNKYAKKHYNNYSTYINNVVNFARNNLYKLGLIDKAEEKLYQKCKNTSINITIAKYLYIAVLIIYFLLFIPIYKINMISSFGITVQSGLLKLILGITPLIVLKVYNWKLKEQCKDKIAVLTQQGSDEKAKWKALANYMKNYSLMKERDVFDLGIWEKYLVYATAFGISDRVIEQMKAAYPEVFIIENWDDEQMKEKYPVINYVLNPYYHETTYNYGSSISIISNNVEKAYKTSLSEIAAHASSSGGGGGGGFSGGGGGRWRPVAGMGGR